MPSYFEVIENATGFKEHVMENEAQRYPAGNLIYQNYCQGILLEESTSADIFSNHINENIKANIALGGDMSGETLIKYN